VSALRHWSDRFDHVVPDSFRVPAAELEAAVEQLDAEVRAAFEVAIDRRRRVSEAERTTVRVAREPECRQPRAQVVRFEFQTT